MGTSFLHGPRWARPPASESAHGPSKVAKIALRLHMIAYESVHVPRKVDVKGSKKAIFRGPREMAKIAVRLHTQGSTKAMFIRVL